MNHYGMTEPAPATRRRRGFTLLEIMIVVSIIGLLLVIAIPSVRQARQRAQNAAFINDLRLLSDSTFELYAINHGDYPSDAPVGVAPPEAVPYLPNQFEFARGTPIGGQWDWDRAQDRGAKAHGFFYAGLSVVGPSRTSSQMAVLDGEIDDGDLVTGRFRSRPGGYVLVFEF